ncbi:MAG: DUF3667 domain-containing protein [Gammaproteobacteria bacterium]|nr:DUF3667 domain-containing protein [Gammaproteobacteria bacterium]
MSNPISNPVSNGKLTHQVSVNSNRSESAPIEQDATVQSSQPVTSNTDKLERINWSYIRDELASILSVEKGIFYTIKELLVRPGATVNSYLFEDRVKLVKPVVFLVICSIVYSLIQHYTGFDDGYINFTFDDWANTATGVIFHWISNNYGYVNLAISVYVALWLKLFFFRSHYNYFEVLVLLFYAMGMMMLIFAAFGVIESVLKMPILQYGVNIGIFYVAWVIGQFFDQRKISAYIRALLSYFLGLFFFALSALIIGISIDKLMQ